MKYNKFHEPAKDLFFQAILNLESLEECYSFFEDICTIAELKSIPQRLQVAIMLKEGRTYAEICDLTKVSTATISRVNRSLEYGADGYKKALMRLEMQGKLIEFKKVKGE
jgi:TrpR-related protein YerC/YecD